MLKYIQKWKGFVVMKKKSRHSKEESSKKKIVIIGIFSVILLTSIIYLIYYFYGQWRSNSQMEELAEFMENVSNEENGTETDSKDNTMVQKLKELKKQNSDLVGWLKIEDTKINHPVVQTDNNDYYTNHNFKKQKDEFGSIFLDKDCSITKPTANFLIYGHRSKRWSNV